MTYITEEELNDAVRALVEEHGGPAIARALGVTPQAVYAARDGESRVRKLQRRILAHFGLQVEETYRITKS